MKPYAILTLSLLMSYNIQARENRENRLSQTSDLSSSNQKINQAKKQAASLFSCVNRSAAIWTQAHKDGAFFVITPDHNILNNQDLLVEAKLIPFSRWFNAGLLSMKRQDVFSKDNSTFTTTHFVYSNDFKNKCLATAGVLATAVALWKIKSK